ncbi:MAG: hypothetical protein IID32_08320, partial [Planctomycetes bacterium]|nr:hypothetical protein [Planctomycetota bacterium]
MKVFSSIVFVLIFASFASGAINEHISYVEFQKEWEYENAAAPNLSFHFHFDVAADSSVEHIELLTPGGNNVVMTSPEFDDESGSWLFEHTYETADQSNFEDYGEGIYQMTVFYYVGNPDLTSFLYSGLLQPTQEPVPVFPKPNQVVTSPVAFQWEPCLDSAASYIWFDVEDLEGNEVFDTIDQPTDAIGTGHIELDEG